MAMSTSCSNLEEAMDKIWFHNNILFFQPSNLNILSMLKKDGGIFESTISSEDSSLYELLQPVVKKNKNKQIVQKMKNLERLNIPTNKILSSSSSLTKEKVSQPTLLRMPKIRRSHWSLYELENYKLKGFNDIDFVFSKEKFGDRKKNFEESKVEELRRPYLSEAWFINRADSPLLNLRILPKTIEGTDMKRYLRFWAQRVAYSVCHELYL